MVIPVRLPDGPNHVAEATGRGYRTACSRVLSGPDLVVAPRRLWRRVWRHEVVCLQCQARIARYGSLRRFARLAGW